MKGLSHMRGNSHVRFFFEGWGTIRLPSLLGGGTRSTLCLSTIAE
jgi:hypothetical protein